MQNDYLTILKKLQKKRRNQAVYILWDERDGKLSYAKIMHKNTSIQNAQTELKEGLHHHPEDLVIHKITEIKQFIDILEKSGYYTTRKARDYIWEITGNNFVESNRATIEKYFTLIHDLGKNKIKFWLRNKIQIVKENVTIPTNGEGNYIHGYNTPNHS